MYNSLALSTVTVLNNCHFCFQNFFIIPNKNFVPINSSFPFSLSLFPFHFLSLWIRFLYKAHINGIIQYLSSLWLTYSLSKCPQVSSMFENVSEFLSWIIILSLYMYNNNPIYIYITFIHWWTLGLLPLFWLSWIMLLWTWIYK